MPPMSNPYYTAGKIAAGAAYAGYRGAMWYKKNRMSPLVRKQIRQKKTFGRSVRKIINYAKEKKFIDVVTASSVPILATSLIIPISLCDQGDTVFLRDGNEFIVSGIQMRAVVANDADITQDCIIRCVIFRANKNVIGVLPTVGELLIGDGHNALRETDSMSDFSFIYDVRKRIPVSTTTGDLHNTVFQWSKSYKSLKKTTFNGAGATIAAAEKNHYFLLLMTNQTTTFQPTWSVDTRIIFREV